MTLVKCPKCNKIFNTKNDPKGTVSCPKKSGGCGHKFRISTNLSKKWDDYSLTFKHDWVRNQKDLFGVCEQCGSKENIQLSNKDHKYSQNIEDYIELCSSCHKKYDTNVLEVGKDTWEERREQKRTKENKKGNKGNKQEQTNLNHRTLLTAVNNYLIGYRKAYERVKTDELSETKRKYEEMLAEKKKLENLL